jgi:hypothetical protein
MLQSPGFYGGGLILAAFDYPELPPSLWRPPTEAALDANYQTYAHAGAITMTSTAVITLSSAHVLAGLCGLCCPFA